MSITKMLLRKRNRVMAAVVVGGTVLLLWARLMLPAAYRYASQGGEGRQGQTGHTGQTGQSGQTVPRERVRKTAAAAAAAAAATTFPVQLPPDQAFMAGTVPEDIPPSANKKLIVMYNRPEWLFPLDHQYRKVFATCPYKCDITDDKSRLPDADAVWIDIARLHKPRPPRNRPPGQMWVAYNIESPVHYQGFISAPTWKGVFNWTFSYRTDSDFFRPYGEFQLRAPARKNYTRIMRNKRKPIAWFVSNCDTQSRREEYVTKLTHYIDVDIFGKCGRVQCLGLAKPECYRTLNTTYFFYLAFENSFCPDYVTEKVFKTYDNLNIIPIVRGGLNYSRYLPPNTYLDTAHFPSPQHLALHLKRLMRDVGAYTSMLRAKDHFYASYTSWVRPNLKPFCRLCRQLQMSPPPPKVYPDITNWGSTSNKCWYPGAVRVVGG